MSYRQYIERKLSIQPPTGIEPQKPHASLFPHQRDLVAWSLRRGRSAIFADTGLGKTRMEIEWARQIQEHTGGSVLVLTPLAVAFQFQSEAQSIGLECRVVRDQSDVGESGIYVTNYDRIHRFDPSAFAGVVLDESSIIKHHDAKTFTQLTEAFREHQYKLCATATPAPNDWTELGTHAEFLGICSRQEMLAEYFCHDGGETQKWRLKGHARNVFWKWVCSWGALIRKPSDLGYPDEGYNLKPIQVHSHSVESNYASDGMLFAMEAQTLQERRNARRSSIEQRVEACAAMCNADSAEPWVVWCDLNDESRSLSKRIHGAVEVTGSDDADEKEDWLRRFAAGELRVLVSKPSICGWGLNWQHCARMAFVGVTDSWEAYYQAVRRCWRFGQKRSVQVHIFSSASEGSVVANLKRKERDAISMSESLASETVHSVRESVLGQSRSTNIYNPSKSLIKPSFL